MLSDSSDAEDEVALFEVDDADRFAGFLPGEGPSGGCRIASCVLSEPPNAGPACCVDHVASHPALNPPGPQKEDSSEINPHNALMTSKKPELRSESANPNAPAQLESQHIHLIGVAGTGMGALAGLLKQAGYRVTGSDTAFHPPIGPALEAWGVETRPGWDPKNLEPAPDLVIVGNVSRRENPEARYAIDSGIPYDSMPGALERFFLSDRPSFVVAGTHGKTTTTSLTAFLLHALGGDPGFLVGGIPLDFGESFALGAPNAPFVIEGDEYDSAFFEKSPKFLRYAPDAAILTSAEYDHVDIYPDEESYLEAFRRFIALLPPDGYLIAFAGDPRVRELAKEARSAVYFYATDRDDTGGLAPDFLIAKGAAGQFELFGQGSLLGRGRTSLTGLHNLRNIAASLALVSLAGGVDLRAAIDAVTRFGGVKRRQELRGIAQGVRVYDDFAHHPTAVLETLQGLRELHPEGKLIAAFEPRSATASRKTHEADYPAAFAPATRTILAPVARAEIAPEERLDREVIARAIRAAGGEAHVPQDEDETIQAILREVAPGDTIVLMSNGPFYGIHDRILAALTALDLRS